ncbi:19176_t:CDS:1, partial [Racocetra fulgida]
PEAIAIEATDIDFMYSSNNTVINNNIQGIASVTTSNHRSVFDDMVDEIETTISQIQNKGSILTTGSHNTTSVHNLKEAVASSLSLASTSTDSTRSKKIKKRLSDLALNSFGLNVVEQENNDKKEDKDLDNKSED